MVECLPTSIASNMLGRMRRVHDRSLIAIFTGPPGIGKTTAIEAFLGEHPGAVAKVTIPIKNARGAHAIRETVRAIRMLNGDPRDYHIQTESTRLARDMQTELHSWRRRGLERERLTLVFDEAQNLSREAVEALRFYNDAASPDAPFPVGLVFVGNHELSLRVDDRGQSTISAAVASRAFYKIEFNPSDLTGADYDLILKAEGVVDPQARALIVRYFDRPRMPRDLRELKKIIVELHDDAGDHPITANTVRSVLAFA